MAETEKCGCCVGFSYQQLPLQCVRTLERFALIFMPVELSNVALTADARDETRTESERAREACGFTLQEKEFWRRGSGRRVAAITETQTSRKG